MICIVRTNFGWFSLFAGLFMAACAAINKEGTLFAFFILLRYFMALLASTNLQIAFTERSERNPSAGVFLQ